MKISIHTPSTLTTDDERKVRKSDASIVWALLFHAAFGALHELAHLCAAWMCGRLIPADDDDAAADLVNIGRALFGRHVLVATTAGEEVSENAVKPENTSMHQQNISVFFVRLNLRHIKLTRTSP